MYSYINLILKIVKKKSDIASSAKPTFRGKSGSHFAPRVFTLPPVGGRGGRGDKFLLEGIFSLGIRNLTRSNFDHLNLFQS